MPLNARSQTPPSPKRRRGTSGSTAKADLEDCNVTSASSSKPGPTAECKRGRRRSAPAEAAVEAPPLATTPPRSTSDEGCQRTPAPSLASETGPVVGDGKRGRKSSRGGAETSAETVPAAVDDACEVASPVEPPVQVAGQGSQGPATGKRLRRIGAVERRSVAASAEAPSPGEASDVDVEKKYRHLGLNAAGIDRSELLNRLRQADMWTQGTMRDLKHVCRMHHVTISREDEQHELVMRLVQALWQQPVAGHPPPQAEDVLAQTQGLSGDAAAEAEAVNTTPTKVQAGGKPGHKKKAAAKATSKDLSGRFRSSSEALQLEAQLHHKFQVEFEDWSSSGKPLHAIVVEKLATGLPKEHAGIEGYALEVVDKDGNTMHLSVPPEEVFPLTIHFTAKVPTSPVVTHRCSDDAADIIAEALDLAEDQTPLPVESERAPKKQKLQKMFLKNAKKVTLKVPVPEPLVDPAAEKEAISLAAVMKKMDLKKKEEDESEESEEEESEDESVAAETTKKTMKKPAAADEPTQPPIESEHSARKCKEKSRLKAVAESEDVDEAGVPDDTEPLMELELSTKKKKKSPLKAAALPATEAPQVDAPAECEDVCPAAVADELTEAAVVCEPTVKKQRLQMMFLSNAKKGAAKEEGSRDQIDADDEAAATAQQIDVNSEQLAAPQRISSRTRRKPFSSKSLVKSTCSDGDAFVRGPSDDATCEEDVPTSPPDKAATVELNPSLPNMCDVATEASASLAGRRLSGKAKRSLPAKKTDIKSMLSESRPSGATCEEEISASRDDTAVDDDGSASPSRCDIAREPLATAAGKRPSGKWKRRLKKTSDIMSLLSEAPAPPLAEPSRDDMVSCLDESAADDGGSNSPSRCDVAMVSSTSATGKRLTGKTKRTDIKSLLSETRPSGATCKQEDAECPCPRLAEGIDVDAATGAGDTLQVAAEVEHAAKKQRLQKMLFSNARKIPAKDDLADQIDDDGPGTIDVADMARVGKLTLSYGAAGKLQLAYVDMLEQDENGEAPRKASKCLPPGIESLPPGVNWNKDKYSFTARGRSGDRKKFGASVRKYGLNKALQLVTEFVEKDNVAWAAEKAAAEKVALAARPSLWALRHRPQQLKWIKLRCWEELGRWLRSWNGNLPPKRAALVFGPVGVGKSTGARCAAERSGARSRRVLEYDLKEKDGRAFVENLAKGQGTHGSVTNTVALLEIDGVCRSFLKDPLRKVLRTSPVPIILICSESSVVEDEYLDGVCLRIEVPRQPAAQVAENLQRIAESEHLVASPESWSVLAEACGGDLRRAVNSMQLLGAPSESGKLLDTLATPQAACDRLLKLRGEAAPLSINARLELLSIDQELLTSMIQENYLRACAQESSGNTCASALEASGSAESNDDNSLAALEACAAAADTVAWGDVLSSSAPTVRDADFPGGEDADFASSALLLAAALPSALVARCEQSCAPPPVATGRQVQQRGLRCMPPSGLGGAHALHWAAVGDLTRQYSLPRTQVCGELLRWRQAGGKSHVDVKKAPRELASRMRKVTNSLQMKSAKVSLRLALEQLPGRIAATLDASLASGEFAAAVAKVLANKAEMESASAEAMDDAAPAEAMDDEAPAEAMDVDAAELTQPEEEEAAEGEDAMELDAEEDLEEAEVKGQASAEESSEADSEEFVEADAAESTEASPTDVVQASEVAQPELSTEEDAVLTEEAGTQDSGDVDAQVASGAGTGAETEEASPLKAVEVETDETIVPNGQEVDIDEAAVPKVKDPMEIDGEALVVDAPAGKAEEPTQVFASGDTVEIFGLQTDAGKELNGLRGKVLEVHDGDRLEVRCKPKSSFLPKIVNLKACNLTKVEATL